MYRVEHFAQSDPSVLRAYMADNPFATLIVNTSTGPSANHIPIEFDPSTGAEGRLLGHVARANSLWRDFDSAPALVVFCAHHAYVSPSWYATKASDPRVVPTWNYTAVHVRGRMTFFHEHERIRSLVTSLTDRFERERPDPWQVSDAPDDFVSKMIDGVVGVEIEIAEIEGKWKLSQNRSREDRDGVRAGLRREAGEAGDALANLMTER